MVKTNKASERRLYYPERCQFYVDINNLVTTEMINRILEKIDDVNIKRLNEVITGIKFYVGGKQWHYTERGFRRFNSYEFNFNDRTILFYISKPFKYAYENWIRTMYGSLRREIWDRMVSELVNCLNNIQYLDLELVDRAKECYYMESVEFTTDNIKNYNEFRDFTSRLFLYRGGEITELNYFSIYDKLLLEDVPENLGFLEILYNRKLGVLKNKRNMTQNMRIKVINELRKIKLKHKYEYNLSELVNYCIYSDRFEIFFRYNYGFNNKKLQRELYYKAKRIIIKYFKQNKIYNELVPYKDSANRTYYFLTHNTFLKVRDNCLHICEQRIKNKFVEQYQQFKDFYSVCPICMIDSLNHRICERIYFSSDFGAFKETLLQAMASANSIEELNDNESYFGVPCEGCFPLVRSIQGFYRDLEQIEEFLSAYAVCPVCASENHESYLLNFYHEDSRKDLRDYLLYNIELSKKFGGLNINIGIPCCHCFEKFFEAPFLEDLF